MKPCDNQVGLFEDDGYTQPIAVLKQLELVLRTARRERSASRKRKQLPDTSGIDMTQPLLVDVVYGLEMDWAPQSVRTTTPNIVPGVFKHLADTGDNRNAASEFQTPPTFEAIATLAAAVLYSSLNSLFNERGGSERKEEILTWLFASTYKLGGIDLHVPMFRMPFTAQFCCMVEEIDYEDLCEAIHLCFDAIRHRQSSDKKANLKMEYQIHGTHKTHNENRAILH